MSKYTKILPKEIGEENEAEKKRWRDSILKNLRTSFDEKNWYLMISALKSIRSFTQLAFYKFSSEDKIEVLNILFNIFHHDEVPNDYQTKICVTVNLLLKTHEKLSGFVVKWRPFFQIFRKYYLPKARTLDYKPHPKFISVYSAMILRIRKYFPEGSYEEILNEFREHSYPIRSRALYHQVFLCVLLVPPRNGDKSVILKEIFDRFFHQNNPLWKLHWLYLLSSISQEHPGQIDLDWDKYVERIFTYILQLMNLPIGKKFAVNDVLFSRKGSFQGSMMKRIHGSAGGGRPPTLNLIGGSTDIPTLAGRLITWIMTPSNRVLEFLRKLVRSLEPLMYPENAGPWTTTIAQFLCIITTNLVRRSRVENKKKRDTVYENIPDSSKLTPEMIREYVRIVFPALKIMTNSNVVFVVERVGVALHQIAYLEPDYVFKESQILSESLEMLDNFQKPYECYAGLCILSQLIHPLLTLSPREGYRILPHLLETAIVGLDLNDIKKTMFTANLIYRLVGIMRLFTEEEATYKKNLPVIIYGMEEWVVSLVDRIIEIEKNSQSLFVKEKKSRRSHNNIGGKIVSSIYRALSPKLHDVVFEKILHFMKFNFISTYQTIIGVVCRLGGRRSIEHTKKMFTFICSRLISKKNNQLLDESELTETEIEAYVHLLSNLFLHNPFTVHFVDELIHVLSLLWNRFTVELKELATKKQKSIAYRIGKVIGLLMQSLCRTYLHEDTVAPVSSGGSSFDYRDWGKYYSIDEFSKRVKHHIPSTEEMSACAKIFNHFLEKPVEMIKKFIETEDDLLVVALPNKNKNNNNNNNNNDDDLMMKDLYSEKEEENKNNNNNNKKKKKKSNGGTRVIQDTYFALIMLRSILKSSWSTLQEIKDGYVSKYSRKRYSGLNLNRGIHPIDNSNLKFSRMQLCELMTQLCQKVLKLHQTADLDLVFIKTMLSTSCRLMFSRLSSFRKTVKECRTMIATKSFLQSHVRKSGTYPSIFIYNLAFTMIEARYFFFDPKYSRSFDPLFDCVQKFCISRYNSVRNTARKVLFSMNGLFSRKLLNEKTIPPALKILEIPSSELDKEENEGMLEGAIEVLYNKAIRLFVIQNWKLLRQFICSIGVLFPRKSIAQQNVDNTIMFYLSRFTEQRVDTKEAEEEYNAILTKYCIPILMEKKENWKKMFNAAKFLNIMVRNDKKFPIEVARLMVEKLFVSDVVHLRNSAIFTFVLVLASVKPVQPRKTKNYKKYEDFLDAISKVPESREEYENCVFVDCISRGFEKSSFLSDEGLDIVHYDYTQRPKRSGDTNEMAECLTFFFQNPKYVKKFLKTMFGSTHPLYSKTVQFFKGLFQILNTKESLDYFDQPLEELLKRYLGKSETDEERRVVTGALILLTGLVRGSKHWDYELKENVMFPFLFKYLGLILNSSSADALGMAPRLLSQFCFGRDNRRNFPIFEFITNHLHIGKIDNKNNKNNKNNNNNNELELGVTSTSIAERSRFLLYLTVLVQSCGWRDTVCGNYGMKVAKKILEKEEILREFIEYEKVRRRFTFFLTHLFVGQWKSEKSEKSLEFQPEYQKKIFTTLLEVFNKTIQKDDQEEEQKVCARTLLDLVEYLLLGPVCIPILGNWCTQMIEILVSCSSVNDQEIQKLLRGGLARFAFQTVPEKTARKVMKTLLKQTAVEDLSWRMKKLFIILLETFFFRHMFFFQSSKDQGEEQEGENEEENEEDEDGVKLTFGLIRQVVVKFLRDPNLEVSGAAMNSLSSVIIRSPPEEVKRIFSQFCSLAESQLSILEKNNNKNKNNNKINELGEEARFICLGLSSFVYSSTQEIKWYLPKTLMLLARYKQLRCLSKGKMVKVKEIVNKTISEFWKTHKLDWRKEFRKKFTERQIEVVEQLVVSPTYYI